MFSLKRSYKWSRKRIDQLQVGAPPDEAFVLTMFFVEKIVRRTLLQLMIWKGLTRKDAVVALGKLKGIWAVKKAWRKYDPKRRGLQTVIGKKDWSVVADSASRRNDLAHGSGNEGQRFYKQALPPLIATLDTIHDLFLAEYRYFGWKGMKDNAGNPV